ncbi:MAG: nucleotide exchange factor GrpE [bacterium]|nr:nucleotide exchange factor GrpE [bacterium]
MSKKKDATVETVEVEEKAEQKPQETAKAETAQTEPETYVLTAEEMKTARERIESLQREKEETVALLQRNQADFDNYRRRNATVRTDSLEEGRRECIKSLLPVLDNFDRAMENDSAEDSSWREGVKLVHRQLLETLQKMGMSEIDTSGKFDPNIHEAVMQEAVEGMESGAIIAVFQKGYRVGDRIIRHSMVKVAE